MKCSYCRRKKAEFWVHLGPVLVRTICPACLWSPSHSDLDQYPWTIMRKT